MANEVVPHRSTPTSMSSTSPKVAEPCQSSSMRTSIQSKWSSNCPNTSASHEPMASSQ